MVMTPQLAAFLAGDQEAMNFWGTEEETCSQDRKLAAIGSFMEDNAYSQVFANDAFVVYE